MFTQKHQLEVIEQVVVLDPVDMVNDVALGDRPVVVHPHGSVLSYPARVDPNVNITSFINSFTFLVPIRIEVTNALTPISFTRVSPLQRILHPKLLSLAHVCSSFRRTLIDSSWHLINIVL